MRPSPPTARPVAALLALLLLLTACGADDGEIVIDDARSRMSPMLVGVAAVFLDVRNDSGEDDVLLSASVDPSVAERVELHETFEADDHAMDGDMDGDMDHDMDGDMDHDMDGDMDHDMDGDMGGMQPTPEGFAMMGMREVPGIDLPAGEVVALEPGGLHVMLIGLVDDLRPGDTFDLTLSFEQAGERTVSVEVREQV